MDLRFLDKPLNYFKPLFGKEFDDLYDVKFMENRLMDEANYVLWDKVKKEESTTITGMITGQPQEYLITTIGHVVDEGQRKSNILRMIEEFKLTPGFPRLHSTYQHVQYSGIVTSRHGEHLNAVLDRSTFKLTAANSLRLCYQLFKLIEKMHERGYVHRHIDVNNIRAGIDWSGEYSLQLHGFAYSAPIDPPPSSYGMGRWNYQSHFVNNGLPYTVLDDYISASYVVMVSQGMPPFRPSNGMSSVERKEQFDDHPLYFLRQHGLHWMAKLYEEIRDQRRAGLLNIAAIHKHLAEAIPGIDPASRFKYKYIPSTEERDFGRPIPKLDSVGIAPIVVARAAE